MSLNCPHAWEEYKKLDLAYDALRREYLALRGEQSSDNSNEFKNVSKEWLMKMREFRGRCLDLRDNFFNFIKVFGFLTVKIAETIMGKQFYGPEEIENAFGFILDKTKIPPIPYSPEELNMAKELGELLVLRISEDDKGNAMTMEHIHNIAQARMLEGVVLYDEWFRDEDFYKNISLKTEWKLIGGNLLQHSMGKNYVEQIKVLRDYLKNVGSLTTAEEAECSDENLAKIADDAKKLAGLEINQKHRRKPGEILYDSFLHFKKFAAHDYLEVGRDLTNIVCSEGSFVYVSGIKKLYGARVERMHHRHHAAPIGVVSVR